MTQERTVPTDSFCQMLNVNVDNAKLNDSEFRQFVRNTLPIVIFKRTSDPNPSDIKFGYTDKDTHVEMDGGELDDP